MIHKDKDKHDPKYKSGEIEYYFLVVFKESVYFMVKVVTKDNLFFYHDLSEKMLFNNFGCKFNSLLLLPMPLLI